MKTRTNIPILQPPETGMDYGDRMYVSDKPYEEQMRKLSGQAVVNNAGEYPESEFNVPTDDTGSYEEMEYWFPWGFDYDPSWELYPLPQLDELPPFVDVPVVTPDTALYTPGTFVINSNTTDAHVGYAAGGNWAAAIGNATGDSGDQGAATNEMYLRGPPNYECERIFYDFDLTGYSGTVVSPTTLTVKNVYETGDGHEVSLQEATHNPGAGISGWYNDFTGSFFDKQSVPKGAGAKDTVVWQINAAGMIYFTSVLNGTALLCLRNYEHDYLAAEPGLFAA